MTIDTMTREQIDGALARLRVELCSAAQLLTGAPLVDLRSLVCDAARIMDIELVEDHAPIKAPQDEESTQRKALKAALLDAAARAATRTASGSTDYAHPACELTAAYLSLVHDERAASFGQPPGIYSGAGVKR